MIARWLIIAALIVQPFAGATGVCASMSTSTQSADALCCCGPMEPLATCCPCEMSEPEQPSEPVAPLPVDSSNQGSLTLLLVVQMTEPTTTLDIPSFPLPQSEDALADLSHNEVQARLGVWLT